jgi:hypothetical protein
MDVRVFVDKQEIGATAAAHALRCPARHPWNDGHIALAAGTSQFEMHAIESNRRKGVILRDR